VTRSIGAWQVAASLSLVAVAVALSALQQLRLGTTIVWAAARALVQLVLVGVALAFVLDPTQPIALSLAWVVAMAVYAATIVVRRVPEVPGMFGLAVVAFAASALVSLGLLFATGVFAFSARTLVPLAGMVVGNAMTSAVVVSRRIVEDVRDRRGEIEARLALGLSSRAATTPTVRAAVRTALIPQIETTRTVGLIFLPGTMTGLILAGASPSDAVLVQLAVIYMILGSTATTTAVVAFGLVRRVTTADHRLVTIARPAD
jgi:putative ABC transport system permease protein